MRQVNSTYTFAVDDRIDIEFIGHVPRHDAKPAFAAAPLRLQCEVTALAYASGSVVLVGGRSQKQAEEAVTEVCNLLGTRVKKGLKLCNLVLNVKLRMTCKLEILAQRLQESGLFKSVSLETELFPAIVLQQKDSRTKASIFASGHVNVTGCLSREDAVCLTEQIKRVM